jgi:hypothetical protein
MHLPAHSSTVNQKVAQNVVWMGWDGTEKPVSGDIVPFPWPFLSLGTQFIYNLILVEGAEFFAEDIYCPHHCVL